MYGEALWRRYLRYNLSLMYEYSGILGPKWDYPNFRIEGNKKNCFLRNPFRQSMIQSAKKRGTSITLSHLYASIKELVMKRHYTSAFTDVESPAEFTFLFFCFTQRNAIIWHRESKGIIRRNSPFRPFIWILKKTCKV
jgi:hypothetical protein